MTVAGDQQGQPVGPRWPQLNKSGSSQPTTQGQQTRADPPSEPSVNTDTQSSSQKTPKDLGPHRQKATTDSSKPVYDPRMPGGGIMPVVPPVAASSRSAFHDSPSQAQPSSQQAEEACEDCQ
ncbi:hypothetical protein O1611_g5739 [Lasiodiplodia mahajangana]|uniref:Uncharacterized protein n=1 Tax=Lasiodiplodia mahajangana TaxID=1108764 RepID=A0ACC2JKP3_9PEZI|nr:hypothetical protein O1611_g5739 [Lasiodiplodia mahajangana]